MSSASTHGGTLVRAGAAVAATLALVFGLVGCRPEPGPTSAPSQSAIAQTPDPTPSSTPTPSAQAREDIELPAACEQLYSPAMLASLQQVPLNDPGVTMTSTQNVAALEILTSGVPTIRCSWGTPGEIGLATNVSIVDAEQSAEISDALVAAGFACEPDEGGTLCSFEKKVITQDDELVVLGEVHVLRANAWISTATIDFSPDGYSQDIVATLWG